MIRKVYEPLNDNEFNEIVNKANGTIEVLLQLEFEELVSVNGMDNLNDRFDSFVFGDRPYSGFDYVFYPHSIEGNIINIHSSCFYDDKRMV